MPRPWVKSWTRRLNSKKVMSLPGDLYKTWDLLVLVAAQNGEHGLLPSLTDCAFALHSNEDQLEQRIEALIRAKLLDRLSDGSIAIHDWDDWQGPTKPSDSPERVAQRVRKHRANKRDGNA